MLRVYVYVKKIELPNVWIGKVLYNLYICKVVRHIHYTFYIHTYTFPIKLKVLNYSLYKKSP